MSEKNEFSEIVQLLIWSYKQGYMHATQILRETIPEDDKLSEMFEREMKKYQNNNAKD